MNTLLVTRTSSHYIVVLHTVTISLVTLIIVAVYTVTVPEDAPIGTVVLRPVSSDRDSSSNKELTFAITSGNGQVD